VPGWGHHIGCGVLAAVMAGLYFLSSIPLANRTSRPANSKTNPKTNRFPTTYNGQKW
jgi:hypothetical protein